MSETVPTTGRQASSPPPPAAIGRWSLFAISAYWFATNLHWMAMLQVIMPRQVEQMAGERQALWLSIIEGTGAVVALIMPPVVGTLSDRCLSRLGRRRPYMLVGVAINLLALIALWEGGRRLSLAWYMVGYLVAQFGNNVATASYSGLIPDVVPPNQRGVASGYMAALSQLGMVVGAFASGMLVEAGRFTESYAIIAGTLVVFLLITVTGVREQRRSEPAEPIRWGELLRSFWVSPREHPNFAWVWMTRFLFTAGMWMVQPFIPYYIRDVVGIKGYVGAASILMGLALIAATITGIVGGAISDRTGRKPVVYVANGVMAACGIGFMLAGNLPVAIGVGIVYGLGLGAYTSVDWALGCDVLPNKEDAAKDMGVWHISMVLPQSIAPFASGIILTLCGHSTVLEEGKKVVHYASPGYMVVFAIAGLLLVASTVLLRNVRGVR